MAGLSWLLLLWPLWLSRRPEAGCPLWMRRSLLVVLCGLVLRYGHWRITASLNLNGPVATGLSLLLLLAEGWLLLSGMLPLLLSWRRFSDGRAEADAAQRRWQQSQWKPGVDVLIPTYGEPLPVLERCLLACTHLNYPHRQIWVLDDAGRSDVAQLARRLGCHYHHRHQRQHAKAGNLNAGLELSRNELVAVFDADFVPQRCFLERTIGLLMEPDVALVQTPQTFLNADPVMRNLQMEAWMLPDEESFYRWIEPVRSAWGAVVCAGTSFVVRRSALAEVGGFVEGAICEDLVTGMALADRGWQLRYLSEPLSAGLAAESMLDFVRQRQRWASGTLQALRLPQGPLRLPNLTLGQRLAYLEGALHWINTVPRLLLLLMPLSIGLLDIVPLHFSGAAALQLLLPLWIALLLSVGWLNRGSRQAFLTDLPSWALAVPLASTVCSSLWGQVLPFRVTPKHQSNRAGGIAPLLAVPLLVLLLLNGLNLGGIVKALLQGEGSAGLWVGLSWSALALAGLLVALRTCWDPERSDPTPWMALPMQAKLWLRDANGQRLSRNLMIRAISETGVVPQQNQAMDGEWWPEALQLCGAALPVLPLSPQWSEEGSLRWQWTTETTAVREAFLLWLYCRPGAWPQRMAAPEWRAMAALLKRLLRPLVERERVPLSLVPQQPPPGSGGW